jgi:F-type H+-transporting ATPase subunit a
LALFTPENSPIALAPFLVIIETVSQFSKVISLGVRLAANITAGHLLLGIFSGFLFTFLVKLPIICNLCPSFCFIAIVALEIAVAFIQAYVFCLLTCVYLGEAYNAH